MSIEATLTRFASSEHGLSEDDVAARIEQYGLNRLPEAEQIGLITTFLRQFLNPLIYILLVAAVVSVVAGKMLDAVFIFVVLLLNAVIGTVQ